MEQRARVHHHELLHSVACLHDNSNRILSLLVSLIFFEVWRPVCRLQFFFPGTQPSYVYQTEQEYSYEYTRIISYEKTKKQNFQRTQKIVKSHEKTKQIQSYFPEIRSKKISIS